MIEVCVEGWRRAFDGVKEFISFRINLKSEEKTVRTEKRYSELHKFHQEIRELFELRERSQLDESFPGKSPFSIQTDLFAERRAKALDAYLQILFHLTLNSGTEVQRRVKEFFNVLEEKKTVNCDSGISVRTPNGLNSEIDRLRDLIETIQETDFGSLQGHIRQLQEKRNPTTEEIRCVDKFYSVKREWEMKRIRSGKFNADSFNLNVIRAENESERESVINPSIALTTTTSTMTHSLDTLKHHVRDQDAILNELAATVHEQRKISEEICAEVAEHNKIIENVSGKQEGTIEGFKVSSIRVKKLQ